LGKKGETFEVVEGEKRFITDESNTQPTVLYGFSTYGAFARMDPEAVTTMESEDISETREMVLEHTLPYLNPNDIGFSDEEQKVIDELNAGIVTYMNERISKFILGIEPLSGFDAFREELRSMGVDKILATYASAYERVK
jgi:putative aldouronate transport system substrate-binding protein